MTHTVTRGCLEPDGGGGGGGDGGDGGELLEEASIFSTDGPTSSATQTALTSPVWVREHEPRHRVLLDALSSDERPTSCCSASSTLAHYSAERVASPRRRRCCVNSQSTSRTGD